MVAMRTGHVRIPGNRTSSAERVVVQSTGREAVTPELSHAASWAYSHGTCR